jgi:hypothetical protein
MDIIILFVLFLTGLAVWRDAPRWLVITGWTMALVLMIGLFRYHVTSSLGLSF